MSLQGLSWRCGQIPDTPPGSSAAGKGYKEQLHLLRGQGAPLRQLRRGRRPQLGPWARPGTQGDPRGHGHALSTPCSPPPYAPSPGSPGFLLLGPLLASSDEGIEGRIDGTFPSTASDAGMHLIRAALRTFLVPGYPPKLPGTYLWWCMF